ncbi:MAG: signal peptidase I [Ilumatobacteraceae bacterium]|jgi:signal peptidase I|nr:signal peptidase I [Ilumatobacteraceae bacterium]
MTRAEQLFTTLARRSLLIFAYALVAVVFGLKSVVGAASLVLDSSLPLVGGHGLAVVTSGSMEPAIRRGDMVLTRDIPRQGSIEADLLGISVDDVISYSGVDNTNLSITHRVVARRTSNNEIAFETKGDAVEESAPAVVPGSRVTGKVVAVIPQLGLVLAALSSRLLIAGTVVLFLTVLFARGWSTSKGRPHTKGSPSHDGD